MDRARAWLGGLDPVRAGGLIYVVAGIVFVCTDSLTKTLVAGAPVILVVWGRHVSYLVAVLIVAGRRRPRRLLATRRPGLQLARGLAMFGATATFFLALSLLPLGEVSALTSTNPLIVLLLAGPLLGERVTVRAVASAGIGFLGVIVLTGADLAALDLRVLAPLATALTYALFTILTRGLHDEPGDVTVFLSGVVGLVAATALLPFTPAGDAPSALQWLGIGVLGLMALTGHRLVVAAFSRAAASGLAPLGYLSLVWSFTIGAVVFGEPATPRALAGAAAIAIGGILALRGAGTGAGAEPEPGPRSIVA
jgi:drug/metabolite transporter (DMT)-like permease